MRIGLVRRDFRLHGGAERFTGRFLEAIRVHGHHVTLITRRWEGLPSDVEVARVPILSGSGGLRALSFAVFATHRIRQLPLDLVHSFERILQQDLYRAGEGVHREWLRRRRAYLPRLARELDPILPVHRVLLTLERRIFQRGGARVLVANSEQVAREIVHHYGPVSAPITVVRNAVDLAEFHPERRAKLRSTARARLGVGPEETVLLFIGSGFVRKGLATLFHALGELPPDVRPRLLVAGQGRPSPYLALARRRGFERLIRFLGVVRDPVPLYAAADAFVLPSLYDPSSNACLEAMATGIPVITTRGNGASELIDEGREGWMLDDPRDTRLLAARLLDVTDAKRREAMGLLARARAEAYPWERHVREIFGLYSALAARP